MKTDDILQTIASGIARAFARVRLKFSMWYVRKGYNWSKDLRKDCINFIWKNQLHPTRVVDPNIYVHKNVGSP
mgnify:CR=1 FL=1